MRAEIIKIGNSRGIRIPKPLLVECGLEQAVDLRASSEGLVVAPCRGIREGWKQTFAGPDLDQDMLLEHMPSNTFDNEDWEW